MLSLELLKKLKILSIITLCTFGFFISSIGFYKQLDTNIEGLRTKAESLEKDSKKLEKESEDIEKKAIESTLFLKNNSQLSFFNVDDELAYFSQRDLFIQKINQIHPNINVKIDMKINSTNTYFSYYNVVIDFSYRNIYLLSKLINYIHDNWFHEFEKLQYNTNTKRFEIHFKIFSNKNADKDGVNFNSENSKERKKGKL